MALKSNIECVLFVEKAVNVDIDDNSQSVEKTIVKNSDANMIRISAKMITISQLGQIVTHFQLTKSDNWMVFLGKASVKTSDTTRYRLTIDSNNCCDLCVCADSAIYLIDCSNGQHICSDNWRSDQNCCESHTCATTDSTTHSPPHLPLNDHHFISCGANPSEVDEKLRSYASQYFSRSSQSSTDSKQSKRSLNERLYQYLGGVIPDICQKANSSVLDSEARLLYPHSPSLAFGDIHGNLADLYDYERLFWKSGKPSMEKVNYLFLGDFVDRGHHSVECALYLLLHKILSPEKFVLVRGNHEVREVNKKYQFYRECLDKFGTTCGQKVWDSINTCFERLPLACVVDDVVLCCHGGIPKSMKTLQQIKQIPKPLVKPDAECIGAHEILWNDPIESYKEYTTAMADSLKQNKVDFMANRARSTGYYYTELAINNFFAQNNLAYMIRAHESVMKGYKVHFNGQVVTVFSSSNYCGKNNTTACIGINNEKIRPIILRCPKGLHTPDHRCDVI